MVYVYSLLLGHEHLHIRVWKKESHMHMVSMRRMLPLHPPRLVYVYEDAYFEHRS